MSKLADLPPEVLLDHILPFLPLPDLHHLRTTSRFFHILCDDDTFWKRKIQEDFNFPCDNTARGSGWKTIYRGLSNPRVYLWGETSNKRLGIPTPRASGVPWKSAPWPLQLHINHTGAHIVSLSAAGMSFFAVDSKGQLYVWGTLNSREFVPPSAPWSSPGKEVRAPMRLALPAATRAVSCGRVHATTLDEKSHVWTFLSFGCPFRLVTPFLDTRSPQTSPHQVASGWSFSAALTKTGDVYVWFPWHENTARTIEQQRNSLQESIDTQDDIVNCRIWEFHYDPHRLPELPPLPLLTTNTNTRNVYLVKIAALQNDLVGLSNHGHVLKMHLEAGDLSRLTTWEYLPHFSESDKIKDHFRITVPELQLPDHIQISHISAQFKTFVAYSTGSSSVVLMGEEAAIATTLPKIISALQNRNVISVVVGDYHYGALTATGDLLTWGDFSNGAVGMGNPADIPIGDPGGYTNERDLADARSGRSFAIPPPLRKPTKVRFDHYEKRSKERFCFAATAAGWHTGALVIDLQDEEDDEVQMPGTFPPDQELPQDSAPAAPYFPPGLHTGRRGLSIFRIGFAGRGGGQRGLPPRGRGF